MERITAIIPVQRRATAGAAATATASPRPPVGRAVIRVNGKPVATLSLRSITELGLEVGRPWGAPLAAAVAAAVAAEKALRDATRRIARRPLSRAQVRAKLDQAGHPAPAVAGALDRLTELGLVDDAAFGRALIDELARRQQAGPALLRAKLAQRGLDEDLIERLVEAAAPSADAAGPARALAEKKLAGMAGLDPRTQRRRLWGLLARRGYDEAAIRTALAGLVAEDDAAAANVADFDTDAIEMPPADE